MNIKEIITERRILLNLESSDKEAVIKELAAVMVSEVKQLDLDLLIEKLVEREKMSSTGIGDGIAIPHCKYEDIDSIYMLFARSVKGFDFDSIDDKPVRLFFLLVAPNTQKAAGEHLRTLAKITRLLKNDELKEKLLSAQTEQEILQLICEEEENF